MGIHTPTFSPICGGRRAGTILVLLTTALLNACSTAGSAPGESRPTVDESVWEGLLQPRPQPLDGAVRITVSEILLLGDPWKLDSPIPAALGIQEMVSASLLRRQDVNFVERRRFTAASEKERLGQSRPRGAPPVGVSPGAELILAGSWSPASRDSAYLDFRLTQAETGEVVETFRRATPLDCDPTSLARAITAGLLDSLHDLGRLPAWTDPFPQSAPEAFQPSGIPEGAVQAFFTGVAAEDRYDWEEARAAYQSALDQGGRSFVEAGTALARTARLRAGGSLGAGQDS